MVLDFERDQRQLSNEEMITLFNRIRDGDLSMVLKVYEQELKVDNFLNFFKYLIIFKSRILICSP